MFGGYNRSVICCTVWWLGSQRPYGLSAAPTCWLESYGVFVTQQIESLPISGCIFVQVLTCVRVCVCFTQGDVPPTCFPSSSQWSFSSTYLLQPFNPTTKERSIQDHWAQATGPLNSNVLLTSTNNQPPFMKPTRTVMTVCWLALFMSHRCSRRPQEGQSCNLRGCRVRAA